MPFLPVDTAVVVEIGPLIDNGNFKDLEVAIAYNAAGMSVDLIKNSGTAITKVDITPTTGNGNDWTHKGNGVYELEITQAQNDTEGTLRIVGVCDGVLPFESPVYTVVPQDVYQSLVTGTQHINGAIHIGTALAGSTPASIVLAASASDTNDIYNGCVLTIVAGTGIGQSRFIADYIVTAAKTAVVDRPWVVTPSTDSEYRIYPFSGILLTDTGVVSAATADTVTLASSAPAVADILVGHTIFISSGTGATPILAIGQARLITAYTDGRVATISPAWDEVPVAGLNVYKILPVGRVYVNEVATDAIDADAIKADAASEIATAIMAKIVDGTLDVTETLKVLLAVLAGDMAKSENTYTYDEQDGTVKVTEVVSANAVERTIA
jgi:hypothetical protein